MESVKLVLHPENGLAAVVVIDTEEAQIISATPEIAALDGRSIELGSGDQEVRPGEAGYIDALLNVFVRSGFTVEDGVLELEGEEGAE